MGAGDLQVDVEDDEIVVTTPGTRYLLAYRRSIDQPRLVMTRSWMGPTTTCAGDKRVSCSSFSGRRQQGRRARLDHVMGNRHRLESAPLLPSVAQSQ